MLRRSNSRRHFLQSSLKIGRSYGDFQTDCDGPQWPRPKSIDAELHEVFLRTEHRLNRQCRGPGGERFDVGPLIGKVIRKLAKRSDVVAALFERPPKSSRI